MSDLPPRRAIVLSGGGARGAYEAGTLRYILEILPEALGHQPKIDIICGTSVGAINAAWLAATIDRPHYCVQRLLDHWTSLRFNQVVQLSYREIWRVVREMILNRSQPPDRQSVQHGREGGMLRTSFFDRIIRNEIPFDGIANNLSSGLIDAVSVTATDIITGRTTAFVQSSSDLPPWTRDARRVAVAGPLTPAKVLASAAIPVLFPAVFINGHWYSDGGLRQNTPISPALRLGADRVLVVSLKRRTLEERLAPPEVPLEDTTHPNHAFLIGKILDALLLDPVDYDLEVLERINAILHYGEEAFKDVDFVDKLNEVIRAHRGQGYRIVEPLRIRPSRDIGTIAAEFAGAQPDDFWGSFPLRFIANRALDAEGARESDLLSYLLFDGGYAQALLDMGFRDASAAHDNLVSFFSD